MLLNERAIRCTVRKIFGENVRDGRLLVRESTIRRTLGLLIEMAVSRQQRPQLFSRRIVTVDQQ